jgi:hypothetical protein
MFSCYLGKGDKETFAYALMSVGEPYTLVRTPPRAIGTVGACAVMWTAAVSFGCKKSALLELSVVCFFA